ncbi:MopE-related protein [Sandaracinus amylolyticus]|uniref:BNR repeat domain protein n=1 Tax=Sandaracinus amylolyticus TaxID=927083 RepID=A0A0F6SF95_9BACT|nr:hypothetical protein [Sandaracinus amylolyticus]AKF06554.1 hypothetical protein DB32_003703 [Sandaracinus amylolyticus]
MGRALRTSIAIALVGMTLPACSVLFDGSDYTGGGGQADAGGSDAAAADAQAPDDAAPRPCETNDECDDGEWCDDGECDACDEDGDGYQIAECSPETPIDCDDDDADIHPGATPICANGVDEACASTAPVNLQLNTEVDELGFIEARPIQGPTQRPHRLSVRAFGGESPRALVLWQIDDGRGTMLVSQPTIGDETLTSQALHELVEQPLPPGANTIVYDHQVSDVTQTSFVGTLFTDGEGALHARGAVFAVDGEVDGAPDEVIVPDPTQFPSFRIESQPALVHPAEDPNATSYDVAVIGSWLEAGTRRRGLVRIEPGSGTITRISPDAGEDRWSHSDGRAAVFSGYADGIVVWNGASEGEPNATRIVPRDAPLTGEPAVHVLRGPTAGQVAYTVLVPEASQLEIMRGLCAPGAVLAGCAFDTAQTYAMPWGDGRVTMSSLRFSETAFGLLWGDPGVGATSLRFASVETEPLAEEITPIEIPAPGVGNIIETAAHFVFQPLGATGAVITIVYAYVRGDGTMGRVHVGAARACLGNGGV